MSLLRNSLMVLAGRGVGVIIQFAAAAVLARLLTPDEFGVFAVASGAVALLYGLRDFGSSNFLVRAPTIDAQTVGSVMLVTGSISVVLGALVAVLASGLASYFSDARIEVLLYILAANFLLVPVALVNNALLVREQRFRTQTVIGAVTALIGAALMVILALLDAGPIALALGTSASTLAYVIMSVRARPAGFAWCLSFRDVRAVIAFGGWLTGVNLVSQASQRIGDLVIGRMIGLAASGLFDKAGALVRLVSGFAAPVIHSVLFSQVAEEYRAATDPRQSYFYRLTILSAVSWPVFLFIAIEAEPLILLAFGAQWREAVPVAFWLAIEAMIATPFLLGDQILITQGRVRALFWQKTLLFGGRLLATVLAARHGLVAVSASLMIPSLVYLVVSQRAALVLLGADWRPLLASLIQPGLIALVVGLVMLCCSIWMEGAGPLGWVVELSVTGIAGGIAWLLAATMTPGAANVLVRRVAGAALDRVGIGARG